MLENITPKMVSGSGRSIELDAQLAIENSSVAVKVLVDDHGLTMTTKKDNIHFPRATWLDVAVLNNSLVAVVWGFGYDQWSNKRKFEKKNPGQTFSDYPTKASNYVLTFKPKKLPDGLTVSQLNDQVKRTYLLAYLDEVDNPTIVACPDCKSMMDVTPYDQDDSLFCENCSRVIGVPDEPDRGICDQCHYYTKLVQQQKEASGEAGSITVSRICHPCRVHQTFWAFLMSLGAAVGIGLLNFATLFFADRFFPALILIGVLSLLWSLFSLVKVFIYSAAQKATGGSPLANATAALRKGKTDKALEIIQSLGSDMTGNPGILMNLSRGLMNAGDFAKAEQFADTMIANFPNFPFGYLEKLNARAAQNASEEEIRDLTRQISEVTARNAVRSPMRAMQLSQA